MDWLTSKKFFVILGLVLGLSLVLIVILVSFQLFSLTQATSQASNNVKLVNENSLKLGNEVKEITLVASNIASTDNFSDYKLKLNDKNSVVDSLIQNTAKSQAAVVSSNLLENQKIYSGSKIVLAKRLEYLQKIQNYLILNGCLADKISTLTTGSTDLVTKWTVLPQTLTRDELAATADLTSKELNSKVLTIKEVKTCFELNLKDLLIEPVIDKSILKEEDLYKNLAGSLDNLSSSIKNNNSIDYQTAVTSISKTFEIKSEFTKTVAKFVLENLQKDLGKLEESLKLEEINFEAQVGNYKQKYNFQGVFKFF